MRAAALAFTAILATAPLSLADETHGQHHQHGGPDLGNIGVAHIDTSCNEAAQKSIDRGLALVHSFWYAEAERAFRKAAEEDADCAMAWWGVAMANYHPLWAPPNADELKTGTEAAERARKIEKGTDREKAYANAIHAFYSGSDHPMRAAAYEKAMAKVSAAYPDDDEAAIFHALSLLGISSPNDKTYANQKKAAEILNRVLPRQEKHPGVAHYIIHSFDYPELAALALPAARVYAKLAPGSPHALHMPSHIFTRLGLWDESIASNLDSAEKARKYMAAAMPGSTSFDELHAVDYLVYAYLQEGRNDLAHALVEKAAAVKKIDNANFAAGYAIAAVPARWALERRQWKEAAALTVPTNVPWEKYPYAKANIHFARGIGAARSGAPDVARDAHDGLAAIRDELLARKDRYWGDQVEIQRLSVAAWMARAAGKDEEGLKLMREAARLEASTEKHPVTPGAIIPARELLAEMLVDLGKGDEALVEAEHNLRDAPNRLNGLWVASLAAEKAGKSEAAQSYKARLQSRRAAATTP
jgi:hypothetical protein